MGVCWNTTGAEWTPFGIYNTTEAAQYGYKRVLPTEEYLNRRVLGKDLPGIGMDNLGNLKWELVLCLLLSWIIVAFSLIKGVKSSGKVVYFTAMFPFVVLVLLLVRGLTLKGCYDGIKFYILQTDMSKLSSSAVWKDAAVQIFFSLSNSLGGLIALSSYNRFHNNALRDSLTVPFGNFFASFFAGFVVFSYLGFLAYSVDRTVGEVTESGVGLAFIVYPAAVARMPVSVMWAILFFVMLVTLGLNAEIVLIQTIYTAILDEWPHTRKREWLVIIITCVVGFILGLSLCTEGGAYLVQLMDHYCGGWNMLIIALSECVAIAYVYGFCRYKEDIRIMIGSNSCYMPWSCCSYWWAACWYFFTPLGVSFILIYSWVDYIEVTYGDYVYPRWAAVLGWLMTLVVVCSIFVTGFGLIIGRYKKRKPIMDLFKPSRYWGPYLKKHRRLMLPYVEPNQFDLDPWNTEDENQVKINDIKIEPGEQNKADETEAVEHQ